MVQSLKMHRQERKSPWQQSLFQVGNCLQELLGHVGATTLVDDVRDRKDDLERDDQE